MGKIVGVAGLQPTLHKVNLVNNFLKKFELRTLRLTIKTTVFDGFLFILELYLKILWKKLKM